MARLMTTDQGVGLLLPDAEHLTLLEPRVADLGAALERAPIAQLAQAATGATVSVKDVRVLPPVPRPSKVWALGLAYAAHVGEMGRQQDAEPFFFLKAPSSLIASGATIVLPPV